MVSAKIGGRTFDRLEKYANREDISRSQAIDRLLKQGLDVEESDMRLVPVKTDGGTKIENQLESVESKIENQSEELKSTNDQLDQFAALMLLSVLYVSLEVVFGLPPVITVLGGTILIGLLSFWLMSTSLRWFNDD